MKNLDKRNNNIDVDTILSQLNKYAHGDARAARRKLEMIYLANRDKIVKMNEAERQALSRVFKAYGKPELADAIENPSILNAREVLKLLDADKKIVLHTNNENRDEVLEENEEAIKDPNTAILFGHDIKSGTAMIKLNGLELFFNHNGIEGHDGYILYRKGRCVYGAFRTDQLKEAANFLNHPEKTPPSILNSVEEVKAALVDEGISEERITVSWSNGIDRPKIFIDNDETEALSYGEYGGGIVTLHSKKGNKTAGNLSEIRDLSRTLLYWKA